MRKNTFLLRVLVSGTFIFSACAPKKQQALQAVVTDTTDAIGCEDFESRSWDAINKFLVEQQSLPAPEDLRSYLRSSLATLKAPPESLTPERVEALAVEVEALYNILLTEAPSVEKVQDAPELLTVLTALELGDRTTESKEVLQGKIEAQFAKIKSQVRSLRVQCGVPGVVPVEGVPVEGVPVEEAEGISSALPLPVYGIRLTMATAYQSCQALKEPAMDLRTPDIEEAGIKITGMHPDAIGKKREIGSLTALLRSHPYYKNVNNYNPGCLKGSSFPMIYDYGGKPHATTSTSSVLDFFKNAGGGTKVLGADCSGFIYAGMATAGLRMSPGKAIKAIGVNGISSRMYVEPQKNGLKCLGKITLTPKSDLKPGDIVAVPGHVLMIDSVGSDTFGLNGIRTADACSKIEAKNFNFVVIQSSPSKNATGMNRYQARDYLYEAEKMRDTLMKYAYYACLAKVNNKSYTPNLGTGSVVRHSLSPSCMGSRVRLAQESCVQGCSELLR